MGLFDVVPGDSKAKQKKINPRSKPDRDDFDDVKSSKTTKSKKSVKKNPIIQSVSSKYKEVSNLTTNSRNDTDSSIIN
jgi:hypothetical protein